MNLGMSMGHEGLEIRVFRTQASESIDPEKDGPMILIGWDMQGP
jgi:hypothetical protein